LATLPIETSAFSQRYAEEQVHIISLAAPEDSSTKSYSLAAPEDSSTKSYNAIEALYLNHNTPRDRQIADRLTALHRDALAEDERILPDSITQFRDFFLQHRDLGFPKITLTPDGTIRVRWIHGAQNFIAIEFTGKVVKLIAEIPRADGFDGAVFY
jgi:hypothetical protein